MNLWINFEILDNLVFVGILFVFEEVNRKYRYIKNNVLKFCLKYLIISEVVNIFMIYSDIDISLVIRFFEDRFNV